jgi:hypothetical protein
MTDRYVIVDRVGRIGPGMDRQGPDTALCYSRLSGNPGRWPAYRIRIQMKPTTNSRVNPYYTDWRLLMSIAAPDETGV